MGFLSLAVYRLVSHTHTHTHTVTIPFFVVRAHAHAAILYTLAILRARFAKFFLRDVHSMSVSDLLMSQRRPGHKTDILRTSLCLSYTLTSIKRINHRISRSCASRAPYHDRLRGAVNSPRLSQSHSRPLYQREGRNKLVREKLILFSDLVDTYLAVSFVVSRNRVSCTEASIH